MWYNDNSMTPKEDTGEEKQHPLEQILEASLVNNNDGIEETNKILEAILEHNSDNDLSPLLEAQIVLRQKSKDEIIEAIKSIPETKIPEQKEFPEFPKEMEVNLKGVSLVTIKGDKGDKGDRGEKGDKGNDGKNGKDGLDGNDGKDGNDGLDGKDGINGLNGKDGKDGSPDTGKEIVEKLQSLVGKDRLDKSAIKGLKEIEDSITRLASAMSTQKNGGEWLMGGLHRVYTDNFTITGDGTPENPLVSTSGSPLTTKGDLYTYSTTNTRLPIGINGQVLIADDAEDTGMKWDYPEVTGLRVYMFANVASDIGTYYDAVSLPIYTAGAEGSISTVGVSTTPTLLGSFATELGYPGTTNVPIGIFHVHYETQKVAGSNNYYSFARIYKRSSGGTETLLLTSDDSTQTAANTRFQATVSAVSSDLIVLDPTDRIVVKVYGVMLSSTATIGLYFDDATDARLEMPASNVDVSNFVPYTGATANVDLGSNDLLVEDEAYGTGWNGSLEVPTKNAVYDKIQSMGGGVSEELAIAYAVSL